MKVRAIDFVYTNVKDVAKAKAFYRDVLGIQDPILYEGDGWVEMDTKPVAFSLGAMPEGGPSTAIALAVDDVKAAVEELRQKGVKVLGDVMDTPVCEMATVLDPDGNPVFLHHRKDGTAG